MAYQYAPYEKRDHLAYITINRPEVMNALHPPASEELSAIWDDFAADPDVWVAILTGAGDRAFSAGNDLKYTAAHAGQPTAPAAAQAARGPVKGGFGGITSRFDLFKPTIAAVNGWAMGGGCEMALACDIIIASENARFGLPEPRVGLFAGAGGVHRLPRQIPLKIAMGMMLTGTAIEAHEAARWGLVNEVVPRDQLIPTAARWAAEILQCAPLAVRGSKEAALVGLDLPLETAMRRTYDNTQAHMASADRLEGPRAFAEKRSPAWTGR
jgi:enoyl-CoA hydratase/carnithine racemase